MLSERRSSRNPIRSSDRPILRLASERRNPTFSSAREAGLGVSSFQPLSI